MKRPSSRCDSPALGMIDLAGSPSAGSAHRPESLQAGRWSGPAVDPDRVRARASQGIHGRRRAVAVGQDEFLTEGQRGDDRDIRGAACLVQRQQELLEIRERLEDDQVDAAFEQAVDLLAERGPGDGSGDRCAPARRTDGSDRPADEGIASADLAGVPGELGRSPVDRPDARLEAPRRQALPVGPERQRLDQLRSRLEVFPMGRADHLRMADDEFLEAGPLRDTPTEQERPEPTVDEDWTRGETAPEALPAVSRLERDGSSVPHRNGSVERRDRI